MPPFRNFLTRKSAAPADGPDSPVTDASGRVSIDNPHTGPLSIRKSCDDVNEFKLSVVNDSGVYLPPSPPDRPSFWRKYPGSSKSANHHRDLVDENEPFSISRESFDSYRRSFDISARSPISYNDALPPRTSLDSRFSRLTSPRDRRFNCPESMEEEAFEDVGLNDDVKPKKKGLFARFGDSYSNSGQGSSNNQRPSSSLGFHVPGRKRGQSAVGSELGAMNSQEFNDA
ncbi:hypothetical protein ASPZODRAFT_163764 [Penicilliopsis zonata CBS 506.65]|uniref:Uncharacterized protein n=1 Tax=Penicilliopsis zonata CBS 506.65 TaxID=1073090 RepID=A0A1L9SR96_9EURO|nr:hypothetical protein ASPZODRAFT_163764 [Penicilliopsis zonata CBS 506.65]OJJ49678.1 hypothetical protein ASPZODRAFT_163764 [Penicilliopsis zonata CBS 506.65]